MLLMQIPCIACLSEEQVYILATTRIGSYFSFLYPEAVSSYGSRGLINFISH